MSPQRYTPTHKASASHQPYDSDESTQRFVIGKIDAGIASVHLIEFPSLLLPPGVGPGSIVNIACTRNLAAEKRHARDFWDLQRDIADAFGSREPQPPQLRVRNTTQTSVTLEWDTLDLAAASLLNLSIYRNGQRLTTIPNPLSNTSTKLSGLSLDTDYAFHLVLKTSAGTYQSPTVKTRTHTIDNTTGISACFGLVEPADLADEARRVIGHLGAKSDSKIQIDTTHYIATSSASPSAPDSGPSVEYQKAVQLSIPIVTPEWLLACSRAHKLVPIAPYYLGQTNRAASLSSAQLVTPSSSSGEPRARPVSGVGAGAGAGARPEPVKEEETRGEAEVLHERERQHEQRRDVIELQEDVEAPPEDAVVRDEPAAPAPAAAEEAAAADGGETDASTRAVKSEAEGEAAGKEAPEDVPAAPEGASVPVQEQEEEERSSGAQVLPQVTVDAPAEDLARDQADADADAEAGEPAQPEEEDAPAPVEQPSSPHLDEAEAAESDVDEGQAEELPKRGEEEEAGEEANTSLVDVKL
ncbi:hypothetical protein DMC30DRAFT_413704 [Rhodotorula diobovata]|uniref:Chitin biosynthesis protein n=1 Tax=Rhodotorula diobovata TaxID=5288 RepID=A0A5C5G4H9_9BASI|nr:hypothetical protein DMC30DRAFT_413704 [Rhodotorula diobovata]